MLYNYFIKRRLNLLLKFKKYFYWTLLLLVMIAIFCFSSQTADESTEVSNNFTKAIVNFLTLHKLSDDVLENIAISVDNIVRKAAHFTLYAIMGVICFNALFYTYGKSNKKFWIIAILICFIYAISDEVHQMFVPGRACMIKDIVIDTLGAIPGSFICRRFHIIKGVQR